jgi:AcrR family transcriptional regulator
MPRAGLNKALVIERAAQLLNEGGPEGLTLAALAASHGVRIPSLYKHVNGMPAIQRGIMLSAKAGLGNALGGAAIGKSREDAIAAMSYAYRRWALAHPGEYPMTQLPPIPGDDADVTVSTEILEIVVAVLAGYSLVGDDAIDATRFFRAILHGFVSLEIGGGFRMAVDLERSFQRLVESVVNALETWSRSD